MSSSSSTSSVGDSSRSSGRCSSCRRHICDSISNNSSISILLGMLVIVIVIVHMFHVEWPRLNPLGCAYRNRSRPSFLYIYYYY